MIEIVKSDSKYPFIAKSKTMLTVSAIVVLASLALLATRGLNLGIDFKGGNKLIVSFTEDAGATPDAIRDTVAELIKEKRGGQAGQIEVQSFDTGETDAHGRKVVKFQIYSELTSLLTKDKEDELKATLTAGLKREKEGAKTADRPALPVNEAVSVDRPAETDKFIIVLKTKAPVAATKAQILDLVREDYADAEVVSEEERAMDMEFFKEYNLEVAERAKANEKITDDDYDRAKAAHDHKKEAKLKTRLDKTYTVNLQQIQTEMERALIKRFKYDAPKLEEEDRAEFVTKVTAALKERGFAGATVTPPAEDAFKATLSGPASTVTATGVIHDAVRSMGYHAVITPDDLKKQGEGKDAVEVASAYSVKLLGVPKAEVESSTSVSPSVGADLFNKGMLAMIYAIIGILIYIGLRFDFRYSPGAVVALIHDTTITLGIFSLFGIKFTLPIISALLTIIGYSLNDTIVVYDRIRENLQKFKGMEIGKLVNTSINETLSRTILTSVTTLFVVLALLIFGGGLIADFALALTIGVVVGTYSSIFVASPIVIMVDKYLEERRARAQKSPHAPAGA